MKQVDTPQISLRRRILFVLFILLGIAIFGELCLRLFMWYYSSGLYFDDHKLFLHRPRTLVWNRLASNNKGFFGDDLSEAKGLDAYRIFLMGGSTSASPVYAKIVKDELNKRFPNRLIEVNSVASARYTSSHNLRLLKYHLLDLKPDCLVIYLGINDNIYNTFAWTDDAPNIGIFNCTDLSSSMIIEMISYYLVAKPFRCRTDFKEDQIRSKVFFESNLRQIIEIAKGHNIDVVLLKFAIAYPTQDLELQKLLRSKERIMKHMWGTLESAWQGVLAHRWIMEKLALEYKIPIGDLDPVLPKNMKTFIDMCHRTPYGEELFGRYVAQVIVDSGILQRKKFRS